MKNRILVILTLIHSISILNAQQNRNCAEIFISEYVEGSRNNKALELYNPTKNRVNLSDYRISRFANGNATPSKGCSEKLSGYIESGKCWVLVIDRRDTTKTGLDTPVVSQLRRKANSFLSPPTISGSLNFNGDDAIALEKLDPVTKQYFIIDLIGKIGEKPIPCWSEQFPYTGSGKWYTMDHTLIRKQQVEFSVDTFNSQYFWKKNPVYFNPSAEWQNYPRDMFDSLGVHSCGCRAESASSIDLRTNHNLNIWPNPSKNSFNLLVNNNLKIESIKILTIEGKSIDFNLDNKSREDVLEIKWNSSYVGYFMLMAFLENGTVITTKGFKE